MSIRSPNDVDAFIGRRIREIRGDDSLNVMAAKIGVTFQQVQKYENGSNRIAASRLFKLAQAYATPVEKFFPRSRQL